MNSLNYVDDAAVAIIGMAGRYESMSIAENCWFQF